MPEAGVQTRLEVAKDVVVVFALWLQHSARLLKQVVSQTGPNQAPIVRELQEKDMTHVGQCEAERSTRMFRWCKQGEVEAGKKH